MALGENIKKIRKEKKITQQELAIKMGISRSYLGDLENNRYNPSSKTLEMLAKKLGVSMLYLTTGKKTINDLNEDELKEGFDQVQKNFRKSNDSVNAFVERKLKALSNSELEFTVSQYLANILIFLQNSDTEDIRTLAAFIAQLNKYKESGKDENINQDELLEFIEGEAEFFKNFLKRYYSYNEGD